VGEAATSPVMVEPPRGAAMTPADLAELMGAFNEVTGRLQQTHESLEREVVRLKEELRAANEQLERSRRLAALGEMAAGIAHEVRNPLGSIGLYARMLEQDLADRPEQARTAGKIGSAVRGLNAVVGDVLSFARESRVTPDVLDGGELLEQAAEACLAEARTGVRVECRGAGLAVWGDGVLLRQALVNIVRNALQAMEEAPAPGGGHALLLEARAAGRGETALVVSDTGPGVSRETIERMFNPFFTTRKTGTGLGLAIVHRIVDAHGGRVAVRNREDAGARGAVFEIVLPGRPAAEVTVRATRAGRDARRVAQGAGA
jgi:signal transduction histidine kinase